MIFSHVLYQLSYPATLSWPSIGSRTETRKLKTGATGLEPATSDVTGRRSNQLNYAPAYSMRDYRTSVAPEK
jgi:hypothetical protein